MLPRIEDLLHHSTKPFSIKLSAFRPSEFPSIFPKIFPIKEKQTKKRNKNKIKLSWRR